MKSQAEITNLWILITIIFYEKGNTGFKNIQRQLEAALRAPESQATLYMFTQQRWGNTTKNQTPEVLYGNI